MLVIFILETLTKAVLKKSARKKLLNLLWFIKITLTKTWKVSKTFVFLDLCFVCGSLNIV